jgi:hypothetical protein
MMSQDFVIGFISASWIWLVIVFYFAYKAGVAINELKEQLNRRK